MGVLSQYIERIPENGGAGIATVQVSLIRPVSEAVRPPRALWVPFLSAGHWVYLTRRMFN